MKVSIEDGVEEIKARAEEYYRWYYDERKDSEAPNDEFPLEMDTLEDIVDDFLIWCTS